MDWNLFIAFTLVISLTIVNSSHHHGLDPELSDEGDISYWMRENRKLLESNLYESKLRYSASYLNKKAKNVIFFLGDGMGLSTITASRIYKGQKNGVGKRAERGFLAWEHLPHTGLAKVFATDYQVSDSAATATSYLSGIKTNKGMIGVAGSVARKSCAASKSSSVQAESIFHWAQKLGKKTGIVTTARVTHASPAPLYSFAAERDWEAYAREDCPDIAAQLVRGDTGRKIDVVLGGGRRSFLPSEAHHVTNGISVETGKRKDKSDLIAEWIADRKESGINAKYVHDTAGLRHAKDADQVLGLFSSSHIPFELDLDNHDKVPSLKEMTQFAFDLVRRNNKNGYVLFIEGGRIDMAHHNNQARKALEEAYQFDAAIEAILSQVNFEDTLVVVSSDHSHALTINGYPRRGNDILGVVEGKKALDGYTYTTLLYGNGYGFMQGRHNVSHGELSNKEYSYLSAVPYDKDDNDAKHAGEDVIVYAKGPGAHLIQSVFDQSYIPHVIAYAACMGPHADLCRGQLRNSYQFERAGPFYLQWYFYVLMALITAIVLIVVHKKREYETIRGLNCPAKTNINNNSQC